MCRNSKAALVLAVGAAIGLVAGDAQSRGTSKVDQLVGAMTVDEKISMLRGGFPGITPPEDPASVGEVGYLPGIPRLGIPPVRFTDGPAGVRITPTTTAMPAPVSLAATFSSGLARKYGEVLGHESRATTNDVVFAPMVNIVRVPNAGRNFETLGEDPALAGKLVAAKVRGIQRHGTIATVKHYAANNQEHERQTINANIDERTLREMYLPAFESAIAAGAGSVMCAYNKVNGPHACESPTLLTDILRKEWGFKGFVVSDYGANQSVAPALTAGMEVEFLSDHYAGLRDAVDAGTVTMKVLDEAVRRVLTPLERFGMLKGASPEGGRVIPRPRPELDVEGGAKVAKAVATAGAVLLKNGGSLPLGNDDLASLVVIGPSASHLVLGGGGSSQVTGFKDRQKSPLTALTEQAGPDANITHEIGIDIDGVPVPASVLSLKGDPGTQGLLRTDDVTAATQIDPQVDFTGDDALPVGSQATWTGTLTVPTDGEYELMIQTDPRVGSGFQGLGWGSVSIDGELIASTPPFLGRGVSVIPTLDGLTNASGRVTLSAGSHEIEVVGTTAPALVFPPSKAPLQVRLAWVTPEMRKANIDAAVAAAGSAAAVVVFAHNEGTEGVDRASLALPLAQDELIEAVVGANARTAVVLNTGDPVTMPWVDTANAILQMWYPGQEGGSATAALLLGKANPGGKLPVTFPRSEGDVPANTPEQYPGVAGEQFYSEGLLVGYRWYDQQAIEPLFPFGHGLSYTSFAYSDIRTTPSNTDGSEKIRVSFQVTNTGKRGGIEVAQVYFGLPAQVGEPPKRLVGWKRVWLKPGETKQVEVHLDPESVSRPLSYWKVADEAGESGEWKIAKGQYRVEVGASSRDIRLTDTLRIARARP